MTTRLAPLAFWVWLVAAGKLALHAFTSGQGYGYFGDELYYLACANHLDWGYVDHPPFSIAALAAWRGVFGDSLFALRVLPAIAGAGAVVCAGALARAFGGRAAAQTLTALVVALAPVHLVVHGYYSMNAWDTLVWTAAAVMLAGLLRRPTTAAWCALGLLLGIGLLNKLSVLWLGTGIGVGLVVTKHRGALATPGPWLSGAIALGVFVPHVLWQATHDWPTAEFVANAAATKMLRVGPLDLFAQQLLVLHPLSAPLWIGGALWLALARAGSAHRIFAVSFAVVAAILIVNGTSRPNYLALAQPPLLAAGAVALQERTSSRLCWIAAAIFGVVALLGAPLALPILAPPKLVEYRRTIGIEAPRMEHSEVGALDQHFADMFGWPELAAAVASAWRSLPDDERGQAIVLGRDYSATAAIELLGPDLGLPAPVGTHNSYWLWGPREAETALVLGGDRKTVETWFSSVEAGPVVDCGYCLPWRNHQTIWIARHPRRPLTELWPEMKSFR